MEVYVLRREHCVEYEQIQEVLGVFDSDNIDFAEKTAKEKYPKDDIWYGCYDLNILEG